MNGDRALRLRIREEHIVVQTLHRGAYTLVAISYTQDRSRYRGYGFSKYNPFDMKRGLPYSPGMGVLKATNKAIDDIMQQFHHRCTVPVIHAGALPLPPDALPQIASLP